VLESFVVKVVRSWDFRDDRKKGVCHSCALFEERSFKTKSDGLWHIRYLGGKGGEETHLAIRYSIKAKNERWNCAGNKLLP